MIREQNVNQEQNPDASPHAALPVSLEFRCPQCLKLYKVDRNQIFSNQPEFNCTKCYCRFAFDYHHGIRDVQTRTLTLPQVGKLNRVQHAKKKTQEMIACPKCQTMNPRTSAECFKCGVIMEKAEVIAKEKKVKALPSLMKLWQELLNDYTNIRKHVEFVDRCEDLHALPFALKKYKDLRETQPHDSMATQMFDSVIMRALSSQAQKYKKIPLIKKINDLPWANIFRTSPLAIGGGLVVAGLLNYEARNLAGAGVALLVLTLGFAYLLFGRVRLADFWRE